MDIMIKNVKLVELKVNLEYTRVVYNLIEYKCLFCNNNKNILMKI